ncbi:MAG: mannitol-1-phosphate 5-dehydrogenase, partial [Armatimonadota bacterium]
VGADPMRKLGREDRLTGGALFSIQEGVMPVNLAGAIAAGLKFNPPGDPSAPAIQQSIAAHGVGVTFEQICGVSSHSELGELVLATYDETW